MKLLTFKPVSGSKQAENHNVNECFRKTFLTTSVAIFAGTKKEGKHPALAFTPKTIFKSRQFHRHCCSCLKHVKGVQDSKVKRIRPYHRCCTATLELPVLSLSMIYN